MPRTATRQQAAVQALDGYVVVARQWCPEAPGATVGDAAVTGGTYSLALTLGDFLEDRACQVQLGLEDPQNPGPMAPPAQGTDLWFNTRGGILRAERGGEGWHESTLLWGGETVPGPTFSQAPDAGGGPGGGDPIPFAESWVSGQRFAVFFGESNRAVISFNADGTLTDTWYEPTPEGPWEGAVDTGTWDIDADGVLVLSYAGGESDTVILYGYSETAMEVQVTGPGYAEWITFNRLTGFEPTKLPGSTLSYNGPSTVLGAEHSGTYGGQGYVWSADEAGVLTLDYTVGDELDTVYLLAGRNEIVGIADSAGAVEIFVGSYEPPVL